MQHQLESQTNTLPQRMTKLQEFLSQVEESVLIFTHDNPDPDSLGAALGMQYLIRNLSPKLQVDIAYSGSIRRDENIQFVKYCGINLQKSQEVSKEYSRYIVVDTQPTAGNVFIAPNVHISACIDHHMYRMETGFIPYNDVQGSSATCVIIASYLEYFGIELTEEVALGLFYGLKTDIIASGHEAEPHEYDVLKSLYQSVNIHKLMQIENPMRQPQYFEQLKKGLNNTDTVNSDFLSYYCDMGEVPFYDAIAEMCQMLFATEGLVALVVTGYVGSTSFISVRYNGVNVENGFRILAGEIAQYLVSGMGNGGGHRHSAGGQIPHGDHLTHEKISDVMKKRFTELIVSAHQDPIDGDYAADFNR